MKNYLWVIVAASFAILSFLFFALMISSSSTLIKKLKKSKANILFDVLVLFIGIGNIGFVVYLLQDVRDQISKFNNW